MSEEERVNRELEETERLLRDLRPADAGIDRDALLFRAGQASMRRGHWVWPGIAAGLAICLAAALLHRPAPREVDRILYVPAKAPVQTPPATPAVEATPAAPIWPDGTAWTAVALRTSYLKLRQAVVDRGLDGLPPGPAYAGEDVTLRQMLKELLDRGDRS